jgi:hypothetical protein
MLGAAASLQPRRTTSQGGKLNSLAEFDSAMKSMFAKTANGVSPTAEALSSRRNLLFVIIGAVVVLGFFLFPSIFGANAASDPVRSSSRRQLPNKLQRESMQAFTPGAFALLVGWTCRTCASDFPTPSG